MKCNVFVIIFLIKYSLGAVLLPSDDRYPAEAPLLQYHGNMSSMWMVDDYGRVVKVSLVARPLQGYRRLGATEDSVFYFLYTRKYNSAYQLYRNDIARLKSSTFNLTHPTKVVIHGFWNSYQSDAVQTVREAYLNSQDVNIIGVDWSGLAAGPWYAEAVKYTEPVGIEVSQFLDFLVSAGVQVIDLHLIGHSLGAHVCAFASNLVTSGRIRRITGLDPALPLFWNRSPDKRLDPSDADKVDCIHTCGGYLGFYDPLCSHDFYPNGGTASQPGCHWDISGACSHGRSYRYFSAAIAKAFIARSCASMRDVKRGRCSGSTALMGDLAPSAKAGLYYLETTGNYPYVKS